MTKAGRRCLEAAGWALTAGALLATACSRPRAKGDGAGAAAEPAPAGGDTTPCGHVLSQDADQYVARRARDRGEADPDADVHARSRYTQCKVAENDEELERASPKRRGEVREVRAALAEWVGARAGLEGAAGQGETKARTNATAVALGDVERLIATTLLPGTWRAGGSPAESAVAVKRTLEGLATPRGEGTDPASYRNAYEGLRRAHERLERAVAPLAPPEAAAVWRFVANLAF